MQFRSIAFHALKTGFAFGLVVLSGLAQTVNTGATFGNVINLGGEPRDIVLDELRGRLYLVNANANRIDIYDYRQNRITGNIPVGTFPNAAAMSPDNAFLYVANVTSSSLTQIELGTDRVTSIISLPARPEGVAVGIDGRVLITTQGTGVNNATNTLLLYDPRQESGLQISSVPSPPTITTPNPLPAVFVGRPATAFPGRLITTPDGNFIIGMVAINQTANTAATTLFVYEVASATVLRNRTVTGQSTVLSISPDGAYFMAGSTLYDAANLNVIAQSTIANLPFQLPVNQFNNFNAQANFGGSSFSPDGATVFGAFNNAATGQRTTSATLLIANSRNLGASLGIKLPESVTGRMVISKDGADLFAISESGLTRLPISTLFDYPILQPETTQVFLAIDECNKGVSRAGVRIANLGKGRLTFSVPNTGAALVTQISTGVAPADITFIMEPGRAGVVRQAGTNLYTGAANNTGNPVNVILSSLQAINIPNTIRVYMNFRNADQRGVVYPVPVTPNNNSEGLWDMILDEPRGLLYLTNSGFNRIEVFDTRAQKFLAPIEVGQLPHMMAMALDGSQLYVGNTGGESIQIVDLDSRRLVDSVRFPALPRAGNQAVIRPVALAMSVSGLQFIMSNGGFWRVTGMDAIPRQANTVTPATIPGPQYMAASPDGRQIIVMGGSGIGYLYDGLIDNFTTSRVIYNTQPPLSYFGPLAASPASGYFLAGGQILSPSLTPIGGAERPGVTQFGPPAQPGQPPVQTIVSSGQRNVASVFPLSENRFIRATTPVRQNITAATRDDARTVLEIVDIRTQAETVAGVIPENPQFSVFATQRANVPSRQLVVDSTGSIAYSINISGLTVTPLVQTSGATQPRLPNGIRSIVNSTDGTTNFRPGSFVTISGQNLALAARADQVPLPTVLGGTCVVFNDVALPLITTGPGQISAQIPETVRAGQNVMQIRSLATAQASDPIVVTVQRQP
ncbi:MAG: hypothetical protein K2X03_28895 [Bryobacteraceae bacterium]|nr:hypothetical protein [Bryobacteraceae bacterium]